jgi:adenylate cyclase
VNPTKFFGELKRRNVYKVAIAYAVIAWLLIQAGSILFPTFEAPSWVMKAFVTVIAAGFPIALIIAWAFEITPEGIVRETEVEASRSITHHTGRKIVALTIVVALIAAGLFLFQVLRGRSTSSFAATAIPNKSIAVLPW